MLLPINQQLPKRWPYISETNPIASPEYSAQLLNLTTELKDRLQLESQKIAELRENKLRMDSELDFVLNKLKSTEASLDESARTNSKLLDTLKALQDKLDSIEDEISLKSRDSQAAEEQHTAELSRVQNELDFLK